MASILDVTKSNLIKKKHV